MVDRFQSSQSFMGLIVIPSHCGVGDDGSKKVKGGREKVLHVSGRVMPKHLYGEGGVRKYGWYNRIITELEWMWNKRDLS